MPSLGNPSSGAAARPFSLGAKFTVEKVGSTYRVMKDDGVLSLATSYLEVAVNDEAFNGLSAGRTGLETVLLKGWDLELDDVLLQPQYTRLFIDGKVKLMDSVNKNMIEPLATATADSVIIEGGELDGNSAEQNAGSGIVWTLTGAAGGTKDIVIRNMKIWDTYAHGIDILLGGAGGTLTPKLYNNNVYTMDVGVGGKKGLEMKSAADFHVVGGHYGVDSGLGAIYLEGCSAGVLGQIRTDGTVDMYVCREVSVGELFVDLGNIHEDGMSLYDVYLSQFSNIKVRTTGSNAWTDKSGIFLGKDATSPYSAHNQFSNIYAGRIYHESNSDRFAYAIKEGHADCDNNQYVNVNGHDCVTGALYLLGAASKGQHQNIIGTVTEA